MPIYALGDQVPRIHPTAYVHPDAVVIGSVTIGARSSVWPTAVLRGDDGEIVLGEETSVQDGSILHTTPTWPTVLGDRVKARRLAHGDTPDMGGNKRHDLVRDQPVMDHDIGRLHQAQRAQRQQLGVARPGADQVNLPRHFHPRRIFLPGQGRERPCLGFSNRDQ